jgi:hypothetical protein
MVNGEHHVRPNFAVMSEYRSKGDAVMLSHSESGFCRVVLK